MKITIGVEITKDEKEVILALKEDIYKKFTEENFRTLNSLYNKGIIEFIAHKNHYEFTYIGGLINGRI